MPLADQQLGHSVFAAASKPDQLENLLDEAADATRGDEARRSGTT